MNQSVHSNDNPTTVLSEVVTTAVEIAKLPVPEFGGRDGPEPTRFGDWEKNGRCIDF